MIISKQVEEALLYLVSKSTDYDTGLLSFLDSVVSLDIEERILVVNIVFCPTADFNNLKKVLLKSIENITFE